MCWRIWNDSVGKSCRNEPGVITSGSERLPTWTCCWVIALLSSQASENLVCVFWDFKKNGKSVRRLIAHLRFTTGPQICRELWYDHRQLLQLVTPPSCCTFTLTVWLLFQQRILVHLAAPVITGEDVCAQSYLSTDIWLRSSRPQTL